MSAKANEKMVGTLTDEQASKRRIEHKTADGHSIVYSNNVALQVTPWDFKFDIGRLIEASAERLAYEVGVTVYMSPQHAKLFALMLARNVASYETQFGEIVLPSELANNQ
jgi:hypothetical protein